MFDLETQPFPPKQKNHATFFVFFRILYCKKIITMKIIKRGSVKAEETKKIMCGKCTSVLEYELKDIQMDREGKYIVCPVCGQFLAV